VTQAVLIDELRGARWFGGKSRRIRSVDVVDRADWVSRSTLRLACANYEDGGAETYVLAEAFDQAAVGRAVLQQFRGARMPTERGGTLVFEPTHLFGAIDLQRTEPIEVLKGEQSNTSLRFDEALMLKLFRRLQFGPNPEVEIGWFLTEHTDFHGTPAVVGSLEYHAPDGQVASLALLQEFKANVGDAWRTTLARLAAVLDGADPSPSIASLRRLGQTTGALHVALAQPGGGRDFDAEPISERDIGQWRAAIHEEVHAATRGLRQRDISVDVDALLGRADGIRELGGAEKIRHHGDYHLGQVLECPDGSFVIIDFEGEPSKPLSVRREKRSPLRDVAGMLRSFDYARNAALRAAHPASSQPQQRADAWYAQVRQAFLDSYCHTVQAGAPRLLPKDIDPPLAALELEKAAYEVLYELNNRPDWLAIPLAALR
jgi:maltose alpha-D-glucosyltransferase / alpha-amylase